MPNKRAAVIALALALVVSAPATAGPTVRVSVSSAEEQSVGGESRTPAISETGRFVAFTSDATNLVSSDTNGTRDIFVRDTLLGKTVRVSVSTSGQQANGLSWGPAISANGRYLAFVSQASNLVAGDTNGSDDIFVRDRDVDRDGRFDEAGAVRTVRVSVSSAERQAGMEAYTPAISANGRHVAFISPAANLVPGDTNGTWDVFVRDLRRGTTARASVSTSGAVSGLVSNTNRLALSGNGRFVAFTSFAELTAGDGNSRSDVFLRDRDTDRDGRFDEANTVKTTRVSIGADGAEGNAHSSEPAISASGAQVAFVSAATNLVAADANDDVDVFIRDRRKDTTIRASVTTADGEAGLGGDMPSISSSGRFVAFRSQSTDLESPDANLTGGDIFLRDRDLDADGRLDEPGEVLTRRVSVSSTGEQGDIQNDEPALAGNAGAIAFSAYSTNLVASDTNGTADTFMHELPGTITRVSLGSDGFETNGHSHEAVISANGRHVGFGSAASNLTSGIDSNGEWDAFVYDRRTARTKMVSRSTNGSQANAGIEGSMSLSDTGRFVLFGAAATNLAAGDSNGFSDVFLRDRDTDGDRRFDEGGGVRTTLVSSRPGVPANSGSFPGQVSANGRYVAFSSFASNVVPGDSNGHLDAFVCDRLTGKITRVSLSTGGVQADQHSIAAAISSTGRYVVFTSAASTLVGSDTNGVNDAFLRDRDADGDGVFDEPGAVRTTRVSVTSSEQQAEPDAALDGSKAFAISSNGRFVVFGSRAPNLRGGLSDTLADVFVRDVKNGTTKRISVPQGGGFADGDSFSGRHAISANGRYVLFSSFATDLVEGDGNGVRDLFLRDRDPDEDGRFDQAGSVKTIRITESLIGDEQEDEADMGAITSNGKTIVFSSRAGDLVHDDGNPFGDIFVWRLP